MNRIGFVLLTAALAFSTSCAQDEQRASTAVGQKKNAPTTENKSSSQSNAPAAGDTSQCDKSLWDHVYDPTRLEVIAPCKVVAGVIEELDENEDGDTHMLLKLDAGYEDLLLKKNKTKKNGDLVIEVVCAHPVTDKKAVAACQGYSNKIAIPNIGDHVRVTGSYVNDTHNAWAEIHPVSNIEKQ